MSWFQKEIFISPKDRGFHLIDKEVYSQLDMISEYRVGVLHLFIKHTSASLAINENADSTVRQDMESYFNKAVPENAPYYTHVIEGPDDMPAHLKSIIIGSSISIPIYNGELNLGVWQGIYICEHRNMPHRRTIIATISGEK